MLELDLQLAGDFESVPEAGEFRQWVATALGDHGKTELTIRVVGTEESRELNRSFRGKDRATNVLSFPAELPPGIAVPLLGDIVICAPLVAQEAQAQGKPLQAHWAHLTVHGVLHLLGHDHQQDDEAAIMESLEIRLLASLGFENPYA